jgi:hypothetical protein
MAKATKDQVSERLARLLFFIVPFGLSLPTLLLGFALRRFTGLPQQIRDVAVYVLDVDESTLLPIAPALGVVLELLSLALFAGWLGVMSLFRALHSVRRLVRITSRLTDIVHGLLEPGKVNADFAALKLEVEQNVSAKIVETEQRLQSEWRFTVVLISSVLLGAVAIFAAMLVLK